jgi:digeranylgeranylglycerophospholipid reductase
MKMQHCDLVIVGAGFAGLACAKSAAESGLTVLVIDRKPHAGYAPHTTGIIVKEAMEEFPVPSALTSKVAGVRLYSPSLKHFDLYSPGYYFYATDTPAYLQFLATKADAAGATITFNTTYEKATLQSDRIVIDNLGVSCKFLVGADGARSRVAQNFGLSQNDSFLVGVEAEYKNIGNCSDQHLHCFLNSSLARGYLAWAVPSVNVTQIGLACRPQFKPEIETLQNYLSDLFDFKDATIVGRRGGLIPIGGRAKVFASERVLLLGDAAGTVSPLTAGGIYPALYTGRCAAQAIHKYLYLGGEVPEKVLATIYPDYYWKRLLRFACDQNVPNWLLDHMIFSRPFQMFAQTIFFHSRGLFSAKTWREILAPGASAGNR